MENDFDIQRSNKKGIKAEDQFTVTREKTLFFRIVGTHPNYELWTATASEDDSLYTVCEDKCRLISAALMLAAELGTEPNRTRDKSGRKYIVLFSLTLPAQEDLDELCDLLHRFFIIYDSINLGLPDHMKEMREIYQTLATDDSDGVYLSDGVWLSADGSVCDRGR